jgi:hypothetical protein
MDEQQLRSKSDADLESMAIAADAGRLEVDTAGQVKAELKRRDRQFQTVQLAKQLEIAAKQEQAASNAAGATTAAAWAAGLSAVAAAVSAIIAVFGLLHGR